MIDKSEDVLPKNAYLYRINQFADEENGPQALLRVLPKELLPPDIDVDTCDAEEAIDVFYIKIIKNKN